ncbi:hypothetical protein ASPNIDRAFT_42013 [Aspergillus niger ATCC 1015]|uniref:Uncharacterized protein n=1 Tax=Aspergillus niger (strain ATCC 1015 / CBS 113.46 / FGSC A1144 / LSHB Ac4 / NCTC 3858a / NRRL 328 / USDA 3528.7) TaxID=380704 RepID=G3XPB3_ASPNA|nr:hypothetical protein ASPNIDRAFT_42013 [Aspergillus niger ATCC 1015]
MANPCGRLLHQRAGQMSERASEASAWGRVHRGAGDGVGLDEPPDFVPQAWPPGGGEGRQSYLARKWEFLLDHPWGREGSTGSGTGAGPGSFPVVGSGLAMRNTSGLVWGRKNGGE